MKKLISCSLSNDNTVDREYETDFILKIIQEKKTDLLILYAQSGVGKSTLCNRILKSIPDYIPICVRTNPENEDTLQPEGTYLERIFNCFVNYFYKNKKDFRRYSFDYYIAHNKNATIKREALESMFSSVSEKNPLLTFGISIGKYISSRLCKLYEYNTANKLHLSTKESMLIAHEYIKYILKNVGICLDIDNLQNIDKYSLQLLTEWISVSGRKSFFIFEYTIPEINNKSSIISFATYFQNINLNVELLHLNSLDVDDAILAIKKANIHNEDNIFFEKIKAFYIYHKDGNMQKLLDFSLQYTADSILRESYDPTYEKLSLIDTNAKYILAIIIMHGGEIDSYLLHEIVKLSSAEVLVFDYDKQINKLFEYDIIEQNGIYYSLIHATMNDAWHNHKKELNRFNLLAYKNCCTYYTNILERNFGNKNNVEEALLFLIKVYSEYDPEKIVTVIDKMNSIVSERIRPEKIFQYFLIFLDYVKDNKSEYSLALYKMMFFCFNHGLFEQCLYIIQQLRSIESEKQKFILLVYEINCFEYLELHKKSISLCEEYLCCENDNHKKYIFYLLLMGCYRSLNKMDKVNMCVEAIQALPDFTEKYEYGIFLRLSEIYMKRAEALPYVEKSVQFYKGKNEFLENKSRITYSFLLAVTDDLNKAEEQLNICIESDKATHYWDSILCLNKASILILREKYGNEVDSLLKKAELSTNSNFDLLLILTLQLINNYEIKNNSLNDYLLTRIVRLHDQESDKHLIALVSYDLYLYYTKIQEHDLAKEYYQVAQETCQYNSTVKFHLNHKKNPNTPNLFRIDWCIGFTFFWNVDYEDISV